MKIRIRPVWTLVVLVAAGLSPFRALTGPVLTVTKPPVMPYASWTGPALDPYATQGQWFIYPDEREVVCTNEFHDNIVAAGGGVADSGAIKGYVNILLFDNAGYLTNFCILATITNDTGATVEPWADGSNQHGESLQSQIPQEPVVMQDTRLVAEFAIRDVNWLPRKFIPPYRLAAPFIEALNEDLAAWYCWCPDMPNPPPDFEAGNYFVPAWNFGTIPPGQSSTRQLCFAVPGGLPPSDPRFPAIFESFMTKADILLNRTTSLKVSTWIDDPALDTGYAYPEEPLRGSDASVFFNLMTETTPDPWKWRQPPNLSATGMDVACLKEDPVLLADDFLCTTNTTVTNIVVWGSWLHDELPLNPAGAGSPSNVVFTLSFHADIPAGGAATWSMPGEPLWVGTFGPGEYDVRVEATQIVEGWYEPATSNYLPAADWTCWRYTFPVDITRTFVQTGTVDHPVVYWLDVQAKPIEEVPSARFGWKTTPTHWNDDACWTPAPEPYSGFWWEMRYPGNHPWFPESIDLAFMLFGGPVPEEDLDFGDAPAPYPTLLPNGARHRITSAGPWLGGAADTPDAEANGQPDPNALGDDNNGNDDENGVVIPNPLIVGNPANIAVTISTPVGATAWLDAWIDWNGNGTWEGTESIFSGSVGAGPLILNVVPPAGFTGLTFARFRIHTDDKTPLPPTGYAGDGEVEDYKVWIEDQGPPGEWKWRQRPDLTPAGMDVECMMERPILLADDFLCTTNTTVTNIVIWGSWLYDELPHFLEAPGDPSNVLFTLSIHADIPAGVAAEWSMPGEPLWTATFTPGTFEARVEARQIVEGWYDPAVSNYLPVADWTCWRYTFPVDMTRAFVQTGTVERPVIYWLDVQALPLQAEPPTARFGWKTSDVHWNDDACWTPAVDPYSGFWWDLRYPPGHPLHPASIDLAFMLFGGPVPEEPEWDFGDAPNLSVAGSPWNYPTRLANNGARHQIDPTGPWLGAPPDPLGLPDAETDGQPDINALGDDNNGYDDENGVQFPSPMVAGQSPIIQVLVSDGAGLGGMVDAWFDWNGDGDWNDLGEQMLAGSWMNIGFNPVPIAIPGTATNGWIFARFRISRQGGLTPTGAAPDGEVEDYEVFIDHADWGDAPDSPVAAGYPTLSVNNGAWHLIKPGLLLGALIDAEPDGQPSVPADGDDLALTDDEDGVQLISGLYPGLKASVKVTVVGSGLLSAWLDINADNDWNDPGEKVLADVALATGTHHLTFNVSALASPGRTYMRWRYSTIPALTPRGGVADGEVEDYRVFIGELAEAVLDFGDAPAPFPTLQIANGARHVTPASDPHILGTLIDSENDGQPGAMASGDDLNNLDDEDGVLFPSNTLGQAVLVRGSNLTVRVVTPGSPWVTAWVDFNGNGSWADAGETIAAAYALSPGTNALSVTAPSGTFLGKTYARFRTSSMNVPLAYTGAVADGEVEDYLLYLCQPRPSGGTSLTITNIVHSVTNGVLVQWNCDPALLTQPQACSNILSASTNPADWAALTGWGAFRFYQDQDATNRPVRFYRILAPFTYP